MKILFVVMSVLLVITAAGSGYFIYDLNIQINELEGELANNAADLGNRLDTVGTRLDAINDALKTEIDNNASAIGNAVASLGDYKTVAESRFSGIEGNVKLSGTDITRLTSRLTDSEQVLEASVLQGQIQYEKVNKSIVTISDGEYAYGSGFIIKSAPGSHDLSTARLVTAYHVVKDIDEIHVTFYDGKTIKAYIQAGSELSDVAILQMMMPLAATNLPDIGDYPALEAADSTLVKPGDPVFVVGSPDGYEDGTLGLRGTITAGIISHTNRCATSAGIFYTNLLQFDAASNYGNSGGPLFNNRGEVIGIVIIRLDARIGDGISFAVTSNKIRQVETVIPAYNPAVKTILPVSGPLHIFKHAYSGITVVDIPPKDVVANDNTVINGAKITAVVHPASTAGVKADDIITMLGDRDIHNTDEFYSFLDEYYFIGDSIILEIIRDGQHISVTLELKEKP